MQPGDIVCFVFRANTPYVLHLDDDGEQYSLVGSAFVYGMMDGELLSSKDPLGAYRSFVVR